MDFRVIAAETNAGIANGEGIMGPGEIMGGGFGLIVLVFLVVLGILWFCLPFAIFGTKGFLGQLIAEQRRTNQLLEKIAGVSPLSGEPTDPPRDRQSPRWMA